MLDKAQYICFRRWQPNRGTWSWLAQCVNIQSTYTWILRSHPSPSPFSFPPASRRQNWDEWVAATVTMESEAHIIRKQPLHLLWAGDKLSSDRRHFSSEVYTHGGPDCSFLSLIVRRRQSLLGCKESCQRHLKWHAHIHKLYIISQSPRGIVCWVGKQLWDAHVTFGVREQIAGTKTCHQAVVLVRHALYMYI